MKNQDGGFKVPLFDRKPSECHVRCQSLIGSYASTRGTFNLIGPCNNIQTHKATKPQRVIFSKWLNKKGSYSRRLLLPFALPPYPLPLSTPATQANHPPRIRLLAHNLLAHVKFNKYSIFLSPPPPREITINSLTLNLKT